MSNQSLLIVGLAVAATLAACASPAMTPVRDLDLPAAFAPAASSNPAPAAARADPGVFFEDDALRALIAEALDANPDVLVAYQRIEFVRAGVTRATGPLWPGLSFRTDAGLTRVGRYTTEGAGNASTDITPGRRVPNPAGDLSLRLQASWEADLWGRLRSSRDAARAQVLASREGANLVVTNLVEEVATAYVDLVALDHVHDILARTIEQQTEALEMIRAQKEAGRTNELAVQQFEAQVASTRAHDAVTLQQTHEIEFRLNALLARAPRPVERSKAYLYRDVAASISTGFPSELLQNRPDVREAEFLVQAAKLDVASARAAYFPRLTISADAAYRAFEPRYLFSTPESLGYGVYAGISVPLLNRADQDADLASARATQAQAMHEYRGVVQRSVAEVAGSLAAIEQANAIVDQTKHKQAAVGGTIAAANELFRAGKASYLEVLLAQQNSLEAEIELIEALRDRHAARIRLYKALGGGWHAEAVSRSGDPFQGGGL